LGKNLDKIAHLPTLLLVIGYPVFWIEMFSGSAHGGVTSPLAAAIFLVAVVFVFVGARASILNAWNDGLKQISSWSLFHKTALGVGVFLSGCILLCALWQSLLPPHLIQEFDALNYHITLPRQHLILGSFAHIPWSTADLYFLPVDFALAPYWLMTALPNKFPQFFFLLGLLAVAIRLVRRFSNGSWMAGIWAVFAILGTHSIGIQAGTAMLDIVIGYLLLAALDSFLSGCYVLAAVELAFYVWSKSFLPIQFLATLAGIVIIFWAAQRFGFRSAAWGFGPSEFFKIEGKDLKKLFFSFVILSVFIAGPFVAKSFYYTGTVLFPFGVGMLLPKGMDVHATQWDSLKQATDQVLHTRDQYGSGRSWPEFIKHFWLIAVPEKGVNNRYDYPVGLMYLLLAGPFFYYFFSDLRAKILTVLPMFVVMYWGFWWMGSQQTRFLFFPLTLLFIVTIARLKEPSKVLAVTMVISLALVSLSVVRAYRGDFGKWGVEVLRDKDLKLLQMAKNVQPGQTVTLDFFDAAYAAFPVDVRGVDSVFVLK